MSHARRLVAAALLSLLACAPLALATPPNLGTPPWKCGHGVFAANTSGCYGADTGDPNAMDDTGVGDVSISPHVLHLGDTLNVTAPHLGGWLPQWPSPPAGWVQQGTCDTTTVTCAYLIISGTGTSWQRFGMSFSFSGLSGVEQDYYAVVAEGREIGGTVTKVDPANPLKTVADPGAEVSIVKHGGGTTQVATNPDGKYEALVADGTYDVATADRRCVTSLLPQCVVTKTVTIGGNQTVDFAPAPRYKISGTVVDEEGNPQAGVTIQARGEAVASDAAGAYSLIVPAGPAHVTADNPDACAIGSGDACDPVKDVDLQHDTTVNWKIKGCVNQISFGSMAAVNGCFKKTADLMWKTDQPFRMNGIDIRPKDSVIFDGRAQNVALPAAAYLLDGATIADFSQGLTLDYGASGQTITPLAPLGAILGIELPENAFTIASQAGQSSLTFSIKASLNVRQLFDKGAPQDNQACPGAATFTLTVVATNDAGLKSANLEAADPGAVFCAPQDASKPDNPAAPSGISLKKLSGGYDFTSGYWTVGAAVGGVPLFGGKTTLSGTLTFRTKPSFGLRGISVKVDGLNKPFYGPWLLQRGGFSAGFASDTGPFSITFNAGFSFGPHLNPVQTDLLGLGKLTIVPAEEVSVDPSLTYSDADHDPFTLADSKFSGHADIKVWDYPLLSGDVSYLPGPQAFSLDKVQLDFHDPGGQIFSYTGSVKGFIDMSRGLLFFDGRSDIKLIGLGHSSGEAVFNSDKKAISVCLDNGSEPRWGITLTYGPFDYHSGGCDLDQYKASDPTATAATAATAGGRAFRVAPHAKLLSVAISGRGKTPPHVVVNGPGLRLVAGKDGSARSGRSRLFPTPDGITYAILTGPRAGKWHIVPQKGSVVTKIRFAGVAPAPRVHARLSGDTCSPTLHWLVTPHPGQAVRFIEIGDDGTGRVLQDNAARSGTLKVIPVGDGVRTIQAQVYQGGPLRKTLTVGTYDAATSVPAAASGLRVGVHGSKQLAISWQRACGAASYAVKVAGQAPVTVKGTSVFVPKPAKAGTIRVTSMSAAGVAGGVATAPTTPAA